MARGARVGRRHCKTEQRTHVLFGELEGGWWRIPGVRVAKHPVRPDLHTGEQLLQVLGQGRDLDVILLILLLLLLWLNYKDKSSSLSQAHAAPPSQVGTTNGRHRPQHPSFGGARAKAELFFLHGVAYRANQDGADPSMRTATVSITEAGS